MTNFLPLLAQRVLNRPLLIAPSLAETLYAILEGRINPDAAAGQVKPDASRFAGERRSGGQFYAKVGTTAIITIDGSLVNRGGFVGTDLCTGMVSYEGIAAQIDRVALDAKSGALTNLVLDINSYGGEATGMVALSSKIRALRKTMHVVAVINDVAASAGYGIASAADRIVVSPTSVVGSIGVVMMHMDRSAELSAKGIRPTLIHAGAKKVDGHPFGPLSDDVRADMTRDVMAFYDQFLSTVEAGRGKQRLSAKKARETEADTFIGQDAIAAGLADSLGTLDEVLAELSRPVRASGNSNSKQQTKGANMDRDNEDTASAIAEDRNRVKTILALPEAKGREKSAHMLAFDTGLSVEQAKATLAGFPIEAGSQLPSTPSIASRAAEAQEIGASAPAGKLAADTAKAGWAAAANLANVGRR